MSQIDPEAQIAVLQQAIDILERSSQELTDRVPYVIGLLKGMVFMLETQIIPENTSKLE